MPVYFRSLARILGALVVIGTAIQAYAEKCNLFAQPSGCSCFTIVVAGNQTGNVDICKTCDDPVTNPFAGCSSHSCSSSFDGTNTIYTFCGSCQAAGGHPHFGLDGGGGGSIQILSASWSCQSTAAVGGQIISNQGVSVCPISKQAAASTQPISSKKPALHNSVSLTPIRWNPSFSAAPMQGSSTPIVSVTTNQVAGANPGYFTVFVRGTTQPSDPSSLDGIGVWIQQPYPSGVDPVFSFENHTGGPIFLYDVGIIPHDDHLRSIDELNFPAPGTLGDLQPPPALDSPFTYLSCLDGTELADGGQMQIPLSCAP